jgi:hypothetical protein
MAKVRLIKHQAVPKVQLLCDYWRALALPSSLPKGNVSGCNGRGTPGSLIEIINRQCISLVSLPCVGR